MLVFFSFFALQPLIHSALIAMFRKRERKLFFGGVQHETEESAGQTAATIQISLRESFTTRVLCSWLISSIELTSELIASTVQMQGIVRVLKYSPNPHTGTSFSFAKPSYIHNHIFLFTKQSNESSEKKILHYIHFLISSSPHHHPSSSTHALSPPRLSPSCSSPSATVPVPPQTQNPRP